MKLQLQQGQSLKTALREARVIHGLDYRVAIIAAKDPINDSPALHFCPISLKIIQGHEKGMPQVYAPEAIHGAVHVVNFGKKMIGHFEGSGWIGFLADIRWGASIDLTILQRSIWIPPFYPWHMELLQSVNGRCVTSGYLEVFAQRFRERRHTPFSIQL